jgi:hypothetical protein
MQEALCSIFSTEKKERKEKENQTSKPGMNYWQVMTWMDLEAVMLNEKVTREGHTPCDCFH